MFDPTKQNRHTGALTIDNGLTLTGVGGIGPGTANFTTDVVLDQVAILDNAALSFDGQNVTVKNTPVLTLGSALSISNATIALSSGESLVNNGRLTESSVDGGTLTNNGTIIINRYSQTISAATFTNNGTLLVDQATLTVGVGGLQAVGASAAIVLDSGNLVLAGTLTTAQLLALYAAQHVSASGSSGFGLHGLLHNAGATLNIGAGTTLGTLVTGDITGGNIIDQGSASFGYGLITLHNTDYQSTTGTLEARVLTLECGKLSGVGTIETGSLVLDDVAIDRPVSITADEVTIDAGQSVSGDAVAVYDSISIAAGETLDNVRINAMSDYTSLDWQGSSGQIATLGAGVAAAIRAAEDLGLSGSAGAVLANAGTFTVSGGMEFFSGTTDNTGTIQVSAGANSL